MTVPVDTRICLISSGVRSGFKALSSATVPLTNGETIEVPYRYPYPVSDSRSTPQTPTPGAPSVTAVPKFELTSLLLSNNVLPTVIALARVHDSPAGTALSLDC